jgi:hypothetical protein
MTAAIQHAHSATLAPHVVIPAQAGIQATVAALLPVTSTETVVWIPACAGMTQVGCVVITTRMAA